MKKLYLAALAIALGTSNAAADSDFLNMPWNDVIQSAQEEGELTFFAWWGEEFWRTAAKGFEDRYDIKVKVIVGDRGANTNKVVAEKNQDVGTIDVMLVGGADTIPTMLNGNVLYGPIQDVIPGADKTDPKLREFQEGVAVKGLVVPVYRNQTGLLYDPERVSNPPQTWDELTAWIQDNPRQFAFADPIKGGSGSSFVQTAVINIVGDAERYAGDTELDPAKVADWGPVWDWFNDNEDNYVLTGSNFESIDKLNQGEVSLIAAWDDDTQVSLSKGTLFKRATLYIPEMGMVGGGDTLGVLANAPHKAAGLLFVSYLIEPEVQTQMNEIIGPYLARTDVAPGSAILSEDERQNFGVAWLPVPYKTHYKEEFIKQVVLK